MKPNIRILGIDDGPFRREIDDKTSIVGVLMRMDGTIETVLADLITVDGSDTFGAIKGFVEQIGQENINVIITEGVTFGGFDIIVPDELFSATGIPVVTATKGKGDLDSMASALEKHGDVDKLAKLRSLQPVRKRVESSVLTLNISGIAEKEAISLVGKLMRVGNVPEPLRIADMIAFSFKKSLEKLP